jgi:hypothetical protein
MKAPTTRKRRVRKCCLGALGVALLAVAALAGGFWWSLEARKKQAVLDEARYAAVCDTISTITEHPAVSFSGFTKAELGKLTFYLIRNGKIWKDTVVHYPQPDGLYEFNISLAFGRFKKTDTIMVETTGKDKRFYRLAGFHYAASLHYGVLGYVGGYDCRLAEEDYTANGRKSRGFLRKQDGLPTLPLPAHWK